jgi:hypothetical protein
MRQLARHGSRPEASRVIGLQNDGWLLAPSYFYSQ